MKLINTPRFALGKLLAGAAICLAFHSAQATLLFQEGFNYSSGGLGGNVNPGSTVAWTGNNNITVDTVDPLLTYSGLNNISANNLSVIWGVSAGTALNSPAYTSVTSGQIYYSFLLDMTALPTSSTYLTALNPAGTNPGGSGDNLDIYIGSTGGLQMRSKGTYTTSTTLSLNTTYLVVMEYDFTANVSSLYVDPSSSSFGLSAPTATAAVTPGGTISSFGDVGFKAQTGSTAGSFLINNVLIGTTWADVTPAAVPEPSTLALAGLGLLGWAARVRRGK